MATGDLNDFRSRIKATLPRWFADLPPILDALLSGLAQAWVFVYSLYLYAQLQTRIKTATDGWLDLIAGDFFGTRILRRANQTDASFRAIIIANLFRERATRKALIQVLTDLTGRAPVLIEPQQPGDTGAYGGTDAITISGTPQVYRNDWQGNQLLYATPRTNYVLNSETSAIWDHNTPNTPIPGAILGMNGTRLISGSVAGDAPNFRSSSTGVIPAGTPCVCSIYLDLSTAVTSTGLDNFVLLASNVVGSSLLTFQLNLTTLSFQFVSQSGNALTAYGGAARMVSGTICQVSLWVTAPVTITALRLYPVSSGTTQIVAGVPQIEVGQTAPGSYIASGALVATVIDYTIDGAGNIVFGQVPASGAVLSWSGTYLNARTSQSVTVANKTFANGDGVSTAFSVAPKYGFPCGYGVAGYYGSQLLPSQMFLIAYRPASAGIPNIAGYGNPQGAYRTPPVSMYGSLSMVVGQVTDADILAAIDSVKPVGTVIWTTIKS